MTDAPALGLALAAGLALGTFYFGTLWLVVRRVHRVAWPAVWLGVSAFSRLAVLLLLVTVLVGAQWERLGMALVGFLAARVVLTRWLGRSAPPPPGRDRMTIRAGT